MKHQTRQPAGQAEAGREGCSSGEASERVYGDPVHSEDCNGETHVHSAAHMIVDHFVNGSAGPPASGAQNADPQHSLAVNGLSSSPTHVSGSAAAAFFARAAQKLNLSSLPSRHKRHCSGTAAAEQMGSGGFCGALHRNPPPCPPALLRRIGRREISGVGKVKVMLRVSGGHADSSRTDIAPVSHTPAVTPPSSCVAGPAEGEDARGSGTKGALASDGTAMSSFFSIDARKKQVTLFDPAACGGSSAPEDRRIGVTAPKMFAFDAIFSQDASQTEICSSALIDVIHAVINGSDGCLFCFGHAKLGKTYTMLGSPESVNTLGVIPCAISWLFCGINEQKHKTGARFSVRVSAVEIEGSSHKLKDLLADYVLEKEPSSGVYLRDDPLFGTQLQNQSEIRVPSAEKAALYLDAAINSRTYEDGKDSHFLYTLHVYQYSVGGKGGGQRSSTHDICLYELPG